MQSTTSQEVSEIMSEIMSEIIPPSSINKVKSEEEDMVLQLETLNILNRMLQVLLSISDFLDHVILEIVFKDIESLFSNYTSQVNYIKYIFF